MLSQQSIPQPSRSDCLCRGRKHLLPGINALMNALHALIHVIAIGSRTYANWACEVLLVFLLRTVEAENFRRTSNRTFCSMGTGEIMGVRRFGSGSTHIHSFLQFAAALLWIAGLASCALSMSAKWFAPFSTYGKALGRVPKRFDQPAWLRSLAEFAQSWTLPKSSFVWFYVFGFLWNGAAISLYYLRHSFRSSSALGWLPLLAALAFACHLLRRIFECVCVHRFGSESRMPIHLWLAGMAHYAAVPFSLLPTRWPLPGSDDPPLKSHSLVVVTAALLFFFCNVTQYSVHQQLAELRPLRRQRESSASQAYKSAYSLPRGGWFEFVVTPHYTAEVGIYTSLVIMHTATAQLSSPLITGSALAIGEHDTLLANLLSRWGPYLLVAWVLVNLTISARQQREWYAEMYPQQAARIRSLGLLCWPL
jgi:3-oxo-5-alpha-steroid 4-dehydrogenase 3 / polyprenol reductase